LNVSSAKTLLKRYGFSDEDPLLEWLNAAVHLFEGSADWPWLRVGTTVVLAGGSTLTLPGDLERVVLLKDTTNNHPLKYKSFSEYNDLDPTASGNPQFFTVEVGVPVDTQGSSYLSASQVRVWPIPTTSLTFALEYRFALPDHANDNEDLYIPFKYHYAVPVGAAGIALQAENEEERAQTAWAQFNGYVTSAQIDYDAKQLGEPGQVKDVMDYFDDRVGWR
jgi:hypothetical protein